MLTETPMSVHLYNANFVVVALLLFALVIMAGARYGAGAEPPGENGETERREPLARRVKSAV
jgi:hypothetical protein